MKRISLKRRQRLTEAQPWRKELREQGYCDWCSVRAGDYFKGFPVQLEEHEIARGIHRQRALDQPCATLLLCSRCHDELHRMAGDAQVCIGLALIRYRRPEHYSLSRYYELTGRRWPDEASIDLWTKRIFGGLK